MEECTYVAKSNEPCSTCPRLMSTLYMCNLLKEDLDDNT